MKMEKSIYRKIIKEKIILKMDIIEVLIIDIKKADTTTEMISTGETLTEMEDLLMKKV